MRLSRNLTKRWFLSVVFGVVVITYLTYDPYERDEYRTVSAPLSADPYVPESRPDNDCDRKNVLLLIADDLRPQLGSYYGEDFPDPHLQPPMFTPNLDKLASRSLLLTRTYAQWASCGPSRASFLTGRRPFTTKVWDLHSSWRDNAGNFTTLPQLFKEFGYVTVGAGKVFHPAEGQVGTDLPSWSLPHYDPPHLSHWSRVTTVGVSWKAVSLETRTKYPLEDEETTDHTVKLLSRLAPDARSCKKPFFLAAGFHKPHLPFVFPEEFLSLYPADKVDLARNPYAPVDMPDEAWDDNIELRRYTDIKKLHNKGHVNETFPDETARDLRRAYYASVSYVDHLVGVILAKLKALELDDNTIVVFMGDHGFSLGENGEWGKHTNFEQSLHAPLMMHVPGRTDDGVRSRALTELVDLYPSLVEAAGFGAVPTCPRDSTNVSVCTEGQSFMPLIDDPEDSVKGLVFSQHKRNNLRMGYSVRSERFRYTEWIQISRSYASFERWDFHNNWRTPLATELYDHNHDPLENRNLAGLPQYRQISDELRVHLHKHFGEGVPEFPRRSDSLFLDY